MFIIGRSGHKSVPSVLRFNSTYISVLIIMVFIALHIEFKSAWYSHVLSKIAVTLSVIIVIDCIGQSSDHLISQSD